MRALSRSLVAVLACTAVLGGCRPLSRHPIAVEAVQEVRTNDRVAEILGIPVECGSQVRGVANETDGIASLQFEARGPKGSGTVAVEGKKTLGTWGVTLLELRPAGGGPHVPLTADIETDTPRFTPGAPSQPPQTPAAAPADVEITLPPPPGG